MRGYDHFGTWNGEGQLIMTYNGPLFWMLKYYDNRERAGQTGEWHTLVYESTHINDHEISGKWFY